MFLLILIGSVGCYFLLTKWMFQFALLLCCVLFGFLVSIIVFDWKDFLNPDNRFAKLNSLGPIIISFAAFALAYQQAEIVVRQENERITESRPYIFAKRIDGTLAPNKGVIVFPLYNSGKSPGMLMRQRTLFGMTTQIPRSVPFTLSYSYVNKADIGLRYIFPLGDLSLSPQIQLDQKEINYVFSGKPFVSIIELDYCEVNKATPRCFTLHLTCISLLKGGNLVTEISKQLDLPYEGGNSLTENYKRITIQ